MLETGVPKPTCSNSTSLASDTLTMQITVSEEAEWDMSEYGRSRSVSVDSSFSDDETASNASSETLCAQPVRVEDGGISVDRLAKIESMLSAQQDMLQKLVSASDAYLPRTPDSEQNYLSETDFKTDEHYEQARIEAGFQSRAEWNAAYIHGLVRIDGEQGRSTTWKQACIRCAESPKVAVCVKLAEEDPYYDHLVINERACCGWCEYEKIQTEEDPQTNTTQKTILDPPNDSEPQEDSLEFPDISFIEYCDHGRPEGRKSVYFISGEGLNREVITTDIPRYLGIDSLARPGHYFNPKTSKTVEGFYIKAYRPPTSAMLEDLRANSKAWRDERIKIVISEALESKAAWKQRKYRFSPSQQYPYQNRPMDEWAPHVNIQNTGQSVENETTPAQSWATHESHLGNTPFDDRVQRPRLVDFGADGWRESNPCNSYY